jgi:hypothetical protein
MRSEPPGESFSVVGVAAGSDLLEQMWEPGSSVAVKTMETIKTGEFELDT